MTLSSAPPTGLMSDNEEAEGLEEEDDGGGPGVEQGGEACASWCERGCTGFPQNRLAPENSV